MKKHSLVHYVKLRPSSSDSIFQSHLVHAVICPRLCMPVILGLPFLEVNDILCDHKHRACIVQDKNLNYNLLKPVQQRDSPAPKLKLREQILRYKKQKSDTLQELLETFPHRWKDRILPNDTTFEINYISKQIKTLEIEASMNSMDINMRKMFSKVFEPIPHIDDLPLEPVARITLEDAEKMIKTLVHINGRTLGTFSYNNI